MNSDDYFGTCGDALVVAVSEGQFLRFEKPPKTQKNDRLIAHNADLTSKRKAQVAPAADLTSAEKRPIAFGFITLNSPPEKLALPITTCAQMLRSCATVSTPPTNHSPPSGGAQVKEVDVPELEISSDLRLDTSWCVSPWESCLKSRPGACIKCNKQANLYVLRNDPKWCAECFPAQLKEIALRPFCLSSRLGLAWIAAKVRISSSKLTPYDEDHSGGVTKQFPLPPLLLTYKRLRMFVNSIVKERNEGVNPLKPLTGTIMQQMFEAVRRAELEETLGTRHPDFEFLAQNLGTADDDACYWVLRAIECLVQEGRIDEPDFERYLQLPFPWRSTNEAELRDFLPSIPNPFHRRLLIVATPLPRLVWKKVLQSRAFTDIIIFTDDENIKSLMLSNAMISEAKTVNQIVAIANGANRRGECRCSHIYVVKISDSTLSDTVDNTIQGFRSQNSSKTPSTEIQIHPCRAAADILQASNHWNEVRHAREAYFVSSEKIGIPPKHPVGPLSAAEQKSLATHLLLFLISGDTATWDCFELRPGVGTLCLPDHHNLKDLTVAIETICGHSAKAYLTLRIRVVASSRLVGTTTLLRQAAYAFQNRPYHSSIFLGKVPSDGDLENVKAKIMNAIQLFDSGVLPTICVFADKGWNPEHVVATLGAVKCRLLLVTAFEGQLKSHFDKTTVNVSQPDADQLEIYEKYCRSFFNEVAMVEFRKQSKTLFELMSPGTNSEVRPLASVMPFCTQKQIESREQLKDVLLSMASSSKLVVDVVALFQYFALSAEDCLPFDALLNFDNVCQVAQEMSAFLHVRCVVSDDESLDVTRFVHPAFAVWWCNNGLLVDCDRVVKALHAAANGRLSAEKHTHFSKAFFRLVDNRSFREVIRNRTVDFWRGIHDGNRDNHHVVRYRCDALQHNESDAEQHKLALQLVDNVAGTTPPLFKFLQPRVHGRYLRNLLSSKAELPQHDLQTFDEALNVACIQLFQNVLPQTATISALWPALDVCSTLAALATTTTESKFSWWTKLCDLALKVRLRIQTARVESEFGRRALRGKLTEVFKELLPLSIGVHSQAHAAVALHSGMALCLAAFSSQAATGLHETSVRQAFDALQRHMLLSLREVTDAELVLGGLAVLLWLCKLQGPPGAHEEQQWDVLRRQLLHAAPHAARAFEYASMLRGCGTTPYFPCTLHMCDSRRDGTGPVHFAFYMSMNGAVVVPIPVLTDPYVNLTFTFNNTCYEPLVRNLATVDQNTWLVEGVSQVWIRKRAEEITTSAAQARFIQNQWGRLRTSNATQRYLCNEGDPCNDGDPSDEHEPDPFEQLRLPADVAAKLKDCEIKSLQVLGDFTVAGLIAALQLDESSLLHRLSLRKLGRLCKGGEGFSPEESIDKTFAKASEATLNALRSAGLWDVGTIKLLAPDEIDGLEVRMAVKFQLKRLAGYSAA